MQPRQMRETSRPVRPSFTYSIVGPLTRRPPAPSAPERRFRGEERGKFVLVVGMPARQGWTVADDVFRRPQDASVVDVAGHVIVGADDVEITCAHAFEQ